MSVAQKMLVFEVNEVPLRIFRRFAELRPGSNLDKLMSNSKILETTAGDVPESFLYPSQTWASLNTGAPYACHKIHWYNDPKPAEFPLYWRTLASNGNTVGIVNTLHSSPAEQYAGGNHNYKFLIPDCFAPDSWTRPAQYQPFQALNLKAVKTNGRAVSMRLPVQEAALTALNAPRYGIRAATMAQGASLVVKILQKKVNRERLRNLQFPLVADIFLHEFHKHQPDLAILFTNHVAANMHRYWYGLFPQDYQERIYDEPWMKKYSSEIDAAVDLLDQYLGKLMDTARKTNHILTIVSSMGQHANAKLTRETREKRAFDYRLEHPHKLVEALTINKYVLRVESAMVPQYVLAFRSEQEACKAVTEMREAVPTLKGLVAYLDINREIVTLSTTVTSTGKQVEIKGKAYTIEELGFQRFEIEDHLSGCHCPQGSLIIYNSSTATAASPTVDYLEYAPAMLKHFGIGPLPYMKRPSFSF